jgi:predicted  nucleic acid-binding Zn-ribbon protein
MNEEQGNLVLELLRQMRSQMDRIENDISDVKLRLSAVEEHLGHHQLQFAALNKRMDRFDERLGRIERRLELSPA